MTNATTATGNEERLFYADRGDGFEAPFLCRECKTWLVGWLGRCECRVLCECQGADLASLRARVPLTNVSPARDCSPCCDECTREIRREVVAMERFEGSVA